MSDDNRKDDATRFQEQMRKIMESMIRKQEAFTPLFHELNRLALKYSKQIYDTNERFSRLHNQAIVTLKPFMPGLELWAKAGAQNRRAKEAGFLPHATTLPFIEDEALEVESLSAAIETHYREHWPEIAAAFSEAIDGYAIDHEAKETFLEALAAHGHDYYRSVCRLLFPEFERITRYDLHGGKLKGLASLREFRQLVGGSGY